MTTEKQFQIDFWEEDYATLEGIVAENDLTQDDIDELDAISIGEDFYIGIINVKRIA